MRLAVAAFALSGLVAASLAVVVLAGDRFAISRQVPEAIEQPPASPSAPGTAQPPPMPVTTLRSGRTRPVAPDAVALPPVEPDRLERADARAPLGEFGRPIVRKRNPMTRLFRPVAQAAGRISSGDITVSVSGIGIVEPDEICRDASGRNWPCGIRARTAFRSFLRGRAMECALPPEADVRQASVACRLGKQDVGEWLVESGWARADDASAYAELAETARKERRGIFGAAPSVVPQAEPVAGGD